VFLDAVTTDNASKTAPLSKPHFRVLMWLVPAVERNLLSVKHFGATILTA
jgi:hypothetical protein